MGTQSSPPSAPPVSSFGRFKLLRLLGSGGMAGVYLADMEGAIGFSKKVALKVVHPHLALHPDFTKAFIGEARLGGYLNHPNIVETYDFGEVDGRFYMAMEYLTGPTLKDLFKDFARKKRLMPEDIVLEIATRVLEGLHHSHEATDNEGKPLHIVHRDVKPSNILFSLDGQVKVADFGVARAKSNVAHTVADGVIKGTLRYMSPEQAWGDLKLDYRSDLFAVGALLFELLAGIPLYEGDKQSILLRRAQDAEIEPRLSLIPLIPNLDELILILRRALAREPDERFQSGNEFAKALKKVRSKFRTRPNIEHWLKGLGYDAVRMSRPNVPVGSSSSAHNLVKSTDPMPENVPAPKVPETISLASADQLVKALAEEGGGDSADSSAGKGEHGARTGPAPSGVGSSSTHSQPPAYSAPAPYPPPVARASNHGAAAPASDPRAAGAPHSPPAAQEEAQGQTFRSRHSYDEAATVVGSISAYEFQSERGGGQSSAGEAAALPNRIDKEEVPPYQAPLPPPSYVAGGEGAGTGDSGSGEEKAKQETAPIRRRHGSISVKATYVLDRSQAAPRAGAAPPGRRRSEQLFSRPADNNLAGLSDEAPPASAVPEEHAEGAEADRPPSFRRRGLLIAAAAGAVILAASLLILL